MQFPYVLRQVSRPIVSLRGAKVRHFPVVPVIAIHGGHMQSIDGLVDSASSDVIFPLWTAHRLGIDLRSAPVGEGHQAGGVTLQYRYAPVRLHLSNGVETFQWDAVVGFLDAPMRRALMGHAGFLQFFDAMLYGARHDLEITPNAAFSGTHIIH